MKPATKTIQIKLIENPELSNRAIAHEIGTNDKAVSTERKKLENRGEIPRVTHVRGLDGRLLKTRRSV
jgi:predicted transcriptional regulator